MIPTAEPLQLRLPRETLVLQPMHGHLNLEPVLLQPGLRCVIGSAEHCSMRLTKSSLVLAEHCVIEVRGKQTLLTDWAEDATWLNDRLITEPRELVPGDRVAIGPFDFRVRPSTADELLYAKLVERGNDESAQVEDVLLLKRAIKNPVRSTSPRAEPNSSSPDKEGNSLDLLRDLIRESDDPDSSLGNDGLVQHISKLLSGLQNQVVALQEREAELHEQLRLRTDEPATVVHVESLDAEPSQASVPSDSVTTDESPSRSIILRAAALEREQITRERAELAERGLEIADQQQQIAEQQNRLAAERQEFESQRQAFLIEADALRQLQTELALREQDLSARESQLADERRALRAERDEFEQRRSMAVRPAMIERPRMTKPVKTQVARPMPATTAESASDSNVNDSADSARPLQTLLTLLAFSVAAFLLSANFADAKTVGLLGWTTAILGAVSTFDLLYRRWKAAR